MSDGYKPRYKADIEVMSDCKCLLVDSIMVPHCDCVRHVRAWYTNRIPPQKMTEIKEPRSL